jgi:hypothetical protein
LSGEESETKGSPVVDPDYQLPHILVKGIVNPEEVEKLFRM